MQSDVIYWFLLILFIGVFAEEKEVKQDSLVLLFENVTADNAENDVSLFVNGKRNASLIATFKYYMNGHISMYWKAGNYKKIFMDATRNIWIANIDENYKGKFYIQSSKKLGEVELIILKTSCSQDCDNYSLLWLFISLAVINIIILIWAFKDRICAVIQSICNSNNFGPRASKGHSEEDRGNNNYQPANDGHLGNREIRSLPATSLPPMHIDSNFNEHIRKGKSRGLLQRLPRVEKCSML